MSTRREDLNNYIQNKSEVTITELELLYPQVSSMTIRRDLEFLEREGKLVRVYGGAKSIKSLSKVTEDMYNKRSSENIESKREIAQKAVEFIRDSNSVYLDSGSTIMSFAQQLPNFKLHIITSGPNIALELLRNDLFVVNLIGGELNRQTISVSGMYAAEYLKTINLDIAFLVASGFSPESGFTNGSYLECQLKKTAASRARKKIMLMDSSKAGKTYPFTFSIIEDIDVLITDSKLDESLVELFKSKGVLVI